MRTDKQKEEDDDDDGTYLLTYLCNTERMDLMGKGASSSIRTMMMPSEDDDDDLRGSGMFCSRSRCMYVCMCVHDEPASETICGYACVYDDPYIPTYLDDVIVHFSGAK